MYKTIEENKDLLKFNAEGVHPADQFLNARKKAVEAVDLYMVNVSIHPAKGSFVSFMKKASIGDKGFRGGYRISYYDIMPTDHEYARTQSLDIKEIATEAFRDELRKYGLTVYAESRAD
jgi:hypothetical protein